MIKGVRIKYIDFGEYLLMDDPNINFVGHSLMSYLVFFNDLCIEMSKKYVHIVEARL